MVASMRAQARRSAFLRLVAGLDIVTQHRLLLERAAGPDIIGALVDETRQDLVAGRSPKT